ncbi:MAG: hypothetical protein WKF79_02380 [Nocardioides sp.]
MHDQTVGGLLMAQEEVGIRLTLKGRREAAAGLAATEEGLDDVSNAAQDVGRSGATAARGLERATDRRFSRGFLSIANAGRGVIGILGRGIATAARYGAVGVGILAVATASLSVKAIGLAGDARETASAFSTVLGPAARGVQGDLDRMSKRFGLYGPELQGAATGFATLGKQAGESRKGLAGFSTDMVRAGLDLSSFYNASSGDAFAALQSGLTGESESLKQFNIFMSDAALNAFALKRGLGETTQQMSEQEKIALRQSFILANLGDAQGDLARTSQGYANQQRAASNQTRSFLTMLGGPLTTAATGAFKGFNAIAKAGIGELEKRLPSLEKKAQAAAVTFERWGRNLAKDLPGAIASVSGAWDGFQAKLGSLSAGGTGDQLGILADNIRELGPALTEAKAQLPGLADALEVANVVTGFLADHSGLLADAMPALAAGFIAVKVAQAAGNVAALISLPLKLTDVIVTRQLAKANIQLAAAQGITAASSTGATVALGATTVATGGATVAAHGFSAALRANPIGAVVTVLALLVGGLILAYNKCDWFRSAVDRVWASMKVFYNSALVPIGRFLVGQLVPFILRVASGWLMMGRYGIQAFRYLLGAAFQAFDGILSAAEKGLGWIPQYGEKLKNARAAFNAFGDSTIDSLVAVEGKLKSAQSKIDQLARPRTAVITVEVRQPQIGTLADGSSFVEPRAAGGPVVAGRPYLVGEKRAEIFVPKVNGLIHPRVPDVRDMNSDDDSESGDWPGGGGGGAMEVNCRVYLNGKDITDSVETEVESRIARS